MAVLFIDFVGLAKVSHDLQGTINTLSLGMFQDNNQAHVKLVEFGLLLDKMIFTILTIPIYISRSLTLIVGALDFTNRGFEVGWHPLTENLSTTVHRWQNTWHNTGAVQPSMAPDRVLGMGRRGRMGRGKDKGGLVKDQGAFE